MLKRIKKAKPCIRARPFSNRPNNILGYNTDLGKIAWEKPKANDSSLIKLITGSAQCSCDKFCIAVAGNVDAQFYITQIIAIVKLCSSVCLHQQGI